MSSTQEYEKTLSTADRNKIFKEIREGKIDYLIQVRIAHPNFLWSSLSFESSGDTLIHICAELGYSALIEAILAYEPNAVDCRNKDDKTALHVAAQFSQFKCCMALIRNGAEVNAIKRADWTSLMLACTKIDKEPHPRDSFYTAQYLIHCGALINLQNKDGWTALHVTAREGDVDIFQLLLKYSANIKIRTKNGRTVLHIAALHGNQDLVEYCVVFCVHLGLFINQKDNCGNTELHEALLGTHLGICEFLINHGADIFAKNNSDFGLLHLAASVGDIDTIKFVLKLHKFDVNERNNSGWTPLHCAARKNLIKAYSLLVENGADDNITDNHGRTAREYLKDTVT